MDPYKFSAWGGPAIYNIMLSLNNNNALITVYFDTFLSAIYYAASILR